MADTKISALTAASALDGTEEFAVNQGATSKKATGAQIKTMVSTSLFVRKTADESVTSSAVLQNDDELVLALLASNTYTFEAHVIYEASTAGDLKAGFTVPTGAVISFVEIEPGAGATAVPGTASLGVGSASGDSVVCGGVGAGIIVAALIRGIVVVSTTAGNLQMQWAQNTSNATASIVHLNSWLAAVKRT